MLSPYLLGVVAQPLTSRIIGFLPGPLWLGILLSAAVVPLRPVINSLILYYDGAPTAGDEILGRAPAHIFLALIVALCMAGSHLLWRNATTAQSAVDRIDPPDRARSPVFTGLGSTVGPIAVAVLLTLISEASNLGRYPLIQPIVDTPMLLLVALPIATFVWAYAVVLISVDRLGQRTLALEPFPGDRALGLRSIGSLVFTGYAILSLCGALYLAFLGHFITDIVLGVALFGFGTVVFVLSMWRLHVQMVAAKREHVQHARQLYLAAYAPLQAEASLETLERQSGVLSAAEAIEKRAESIHEWPIDDRTVARLAIVLTGVVTGLVVRGIAEVFGF